jgi:signal peptidase I
VLQSLFRIIPLPLILFLLSITTGIIVAWDTLKQRRSSSPRPADAKLPWWLDISHAIFPVVTIVFLLRAFLFEPFVIPSTSMVPTLEIGDFILVNKFKYGIRLPIIEKKIIEIEHPKRGDVVVFRYPLDPSTDYIKRLIGLPGDVIEYKKNKQIFINGKPMKLEASGIHTYDENESAPVVVSARRFHTATDTIQHDVLLNDDTPPVSLENVHQATTYSWCEYAQDNSGFRCHVPPGHYFMMGDNRDKSYDSRYWGFVPDENLRGKALLIWFNWSHFKNFDFSRFGYKL